MIVEPLDDEIEWDNFVADSPDGTFFHTIKWRDVIERSFPYQSSYLCIRDSSGQLVGVCPFFITKKLWPFKVLDSLPDSDLGGPLFKEEYKKDAAKVLVNYLIELGANKGIAYTKMRLSDLEACEYLRTNDSKVDDASGTMILDLCETPVDYIWNNVFEHKQRKYINRFDHDGFKTTNGTDMHELEIFYNLYCNNWGNGGTPFNLKYLENIYNLLYPSNFSITLIGNDDKCIGAGLNFIYRQKKTMYMAGVALDKEMSSRYKIYYKLRWETIKYAHSMRYHYVSLGPTSSDKSEIHHNIKRKFGARFDQEYCLYIVNNNYLFSLRANVINIGRNAKKILPNRMYNEFGRRLL